MNGLAYERLHLNLQWLKLHTVDTILDNYLEIAAREGKTTLEVLDYLVDQEKHAKDAASQKTRMKLAGFPVKKRLEDFDFEFQPLIDRAVISDLAMLRFVYNAENVVFLGPPGVGKSHLAVAIGIEAVKAGLTCLLIARVLTVFSSLCLNDTRRPRPFLRRINPMVNGVRFSMIRLSLLLFWTGFCTIALR